jgi:hypothetical protein
MSQELICGWLGLSAGGWPPDHYRLLGLSPGENNPTLIEERVHQRLDMVRCYQMTHPEAATEAMNRIAQAFVCLTEPTSKRVYDIELLGSAAPETAAESQTGTATLDPLLATEDRDPLVLVYNPTSQDTAPPIRLQYDPANENAAPPIRLQYDPANDRAAPPIRRPQPAAPAPEAIPVVVEVAEVPVAIPVVEAVPVAEAAPVVEAAPVPVRRRGLEAHRQLYRRLVQTRRLIDQWNRAGQYLASPKRRLTRVADFNQLQSILAEIRQTLRSFPPLLGEAGQAGYLVLALLQLSSPTTLQSLEPGQRESLSRDWQAGQQVLRSHLEFLRQEARTFHNRTFPQLLGGIIRKTTWENPGRILIALAVLAFCIAFLRTYIYPVVEDLVKGSLEKVVPSSRSAVHEN